MNDETVMKLRLSWYNFDGSVKQFIDKYDLDLEWRYAYKILTGERYKHLEVLGKSDAVLYKRIDDPKQPLPMTEGYVERRIDNAADMVVAYHVQQGSELAASMLYNKFSYSTRLIIAKMLFKSDFNKTRDNLQVEDLTADCLTAVIMQVKKSYRPNKGSNFNSFYTSVVRNTVKSYLTSQTKSTDALNQQREVHDPVYDWNVVKPTDSVFE
jgi:hypothetical protein